MIYLKSSRKSVVKLARPSSQDGHSGQVFITSANKCDEKTAAPRHAYRGAAVFSSHLLADVMRKQPPLGMHTEFQNVRWNVHTLWVVDMVWRRLQLRLIRMGSHESGTRIKQGWIKWQNDRQQQISELQDFDYFNPNNTHRTPTRKGNCCFKTWQVKTITIT